MYPIAGICAACRRIIKVGVDTGIYVCPELCFQILAAEQCGGARSRPPAVNNRHKVGRFRVELQRIHRLIPFFGVCKRRLGIGQTRTQRLFFKRRDLAAAEFVPDRNVQSGNRRNHQRKNHNQHQRSG